MDIMVLYGREFDSNPKYEKTAEFLNTGTMNCRDRLERLITYLGDQSQADQDDGTFKD